MKNVNSISENAPAIVVESTEKSQVFTAACSAMKQENAHDGQRMVASSEAMGKPQTFSAACEGMKAQIKDEAQRIVGSPAAMLQVKGSANDLSIETPQTPVVACSVPKK
jgi:hypothetical protein